jgi:hypothetical protein
MFAVENISGVAESAALRSGPLPVVESDEDDELASGVSAFLVSEGIGDFGEGVALVDGGLEFPGLDELCQCRYVIGIERTPYRR